MLSHVRKHSGQSAFGCLADTALCDQAGHQTRRCDVKSRIAAPGTFGHDLDGDNVTRSRFALDFRNFICGAFLNRNVAAIFQRPVDGR